ncbi:hypothetical protein N7519_001394 [Penicillium mononematosum]|uniref:uncharacterized protein n=1 Tax=Penicillium mononematosum TaxID=268346 RepID=UPI00254763E9|nr:uncharacterized protein N7519_001394 [Penicillium mononematosum]KAJ6191373.1 hypothetical protein N7519_001394 [Penicillium mononematosum]
MIPGDSGEQKSGKADRLPTKIKGGAIYGGDILAKKVSELIHEMKIGNWIWTVARFHEAKEIVNDASRMYLIPLSDTFTLFLKTDEGRTSQQVLEEGQYAYIKTDAIVCARASVIFLIPP